jgi:hypothetical protein
LFTDFLHFHEANLGFEPSAPYRQPYPGGGALQNINPKLLMATSSVLQSVAYTNNSDSDSDDEYKGNQNSDGSGGPRPAKTTPAISFQWRSYIKGYLQASPSPIA